ncbi:hypothetical protein F5B22DRAFT_644983 [Xylaria bambusicola]|uniref:uncharacterized protein n=1 Tax=Xylaria bambusicola TaxID=326684 RepID=UPI002007895F|nr:uncharacterized protein F5B22DRAFT_644983 [Xylaria bambusicola]KAI0518218.1 hypothetical protein F5B22DRAFT_644983 [Xylaria bambusicola]
MARTKQTAKYIGPSITWTQFHLPLEQEWPLWSLSHADGHASPLVGIKYFQKTLLGRMVVAPEQAAYIIDSNTLEKMALRAYGKLGGEDTRKDGTDEAG